MPSAHVAHTAGIDATSATAIVTGSVMVAPVPSGHSVIVTLTASLMVGSTVASALEVTTIGSPSAQ